MRRPEITLTDPNRLLISDIHFPQIMKFWKTGLNLKKTTNFCWKKSKSSQRLFLFSLVAAVQATQKLIHSIFFFS